MTGSYLKIDGKPVIDAKRRVVIEVSRADISSAKSKDPSGCAVAKACLRQVPKCTSVRIYKSRAYLKMGDKWLRYHTPEAMRLEIVAFDRGGANQFLPGVYTLVPLQPSHQTRGKALSKTKPIKKKKDDPAKRKRPPYHYIEGVREFNKG